MSAPRPLVVNCLRVDPRTPGLKFHTTSRMEGWENGASETRRQTVRDFLLEMRAKAVPLVVAINADAFSLKTAFDREDPCDLSGLAVAAGTPVSLPSGSPSLVIRNDGSLRMEALAADAKLDDIELAVSGFAFCLQGGKALPSGPDLHPRTGFGLSEKGDYLFLMTIDGRQPASAGATTEELGSLLSRVGAEVAINMDGGGSTTLAWWNPQVAAADACELLNRPVGNGRSWSPQSDPATFRISERTNGNNFGISWQE
ncbi:MAG: phosphodiester glycosidase family protein [Planctomycetota bacterium]